MKTIVSCFLALAFVTEGCASAPPESFHTLSSGVRAAASPPPAFARSVVVMRPALPQTVDRPQLVMVVDTNQVEILEQRRWAEPLRAGIPRVVAESLGTMLGTWRVSGRDDAIDNPDCRVALDFRRFDAHVDANTGTNGGVTIDALWTVTCEGGAKRMGQTVAYASLTGASVQPRHQAIVAAHGRALEVVSRDIAQALLQVP